MCLWLGGGGRATLWLSVISYKWNKLLVVALKLGPQHSYLSACFLPTLRNQTTSLVVNKLRDSWNWSRVSLWYYVVVCTCIMYLVCLDMTLLIGVPTLLSWYVPIEAILDSARMILQPCVPCSGWDWYQTSAEQAHTAVHFHSKQLK